MSEAVPKFASVTGGSSVGRGGLPMAAVDQIYADYLRLKSCAKVGKLHGRTRQSIHALLKTHGRERCGRRLKTGAEVVWHDGIKFTVETGTGFLRAGRHSTIGGEVYLHRRIWAAAHGPIPKGMEVIALDDDKRNLALSNLALLPRTTQSRRVSGGKNQHTQPAQELRLEQYERLVYKVAHHWHQRNRCVDLEDLAQEGRIALLQAHAKWRPGRASFATYAHYFLQNSLRRFIIKTGTTIYIPEHKWGKVYAPTVSLDLPIGEDGTATLADVIAAPEAEEQLPEQRDLALLVQLALAKLPVRQRDILEKRFIEERTLRNNKLLRTAA